MESTNELEKLSQARKNTRHSGFGVIFDCNRGHDAGNEKLTQIKIIDLSINPKIKRTASMQLTSQVLQPMFTYVNLMIFWAPGSSGEPFVRKIGDIIRFRNFEFTVFNGQLQAKNRRGSSWDLYAISSGERKYQPYSRSTGDQGSIKNEESREFLNERLDKLFKWSYNFFAKYSLKDLGWYSFDNVPADGSATNFDLLAKVIKIDNKLNNITCFHVLCEDYVTKYQILLPSNHTGIVKVGDIVKLRSIEKIQQNYLFPHSKYQAILPLPKNSIDAKSFGAEAAQREGAEEIKEMISENEKINENSRGSGYHYESSMMSEELFEESNQGPIITGSESKNRRYKGYTMEKAKKTMVGSLEVIESSAISNEYKQLPLKEMSSLLLATTDNQIKQAIMKTPRIKIKGQIWHISPKNLLSAIRLECRTCGLVRRIDSNEGDICCQKEMKRIWFVKILLKDQTIRNTKEFLVVWIFSGVDDNPKYIFQDIDLDNITNDNINEYEQIYAKKIESLLNPNRSFEMLLTYFDCGLDALAGQVPLKIVDTVFLEDAE